MCYQTFTLFIIVITMYCSFSQSYKALCMLHTASCSAGDSDSLCMTNMQEVGVQTDCIVLYCAVRCKLCIPTVFHIGHFSSCTGSRREEWGTIIALIIGWPANIPAKETWRWDGDVGGHQVSWHVWYLFRRHPVCTIVCACVHGHTYHFVNSSHPQKLPEAEIRAGEELQPGASVVHVSLLPVGAADSPSAWNK